MNIIECSNLSKTYEYYKKAPGLLNSIKSMFRREILFNQAVKDVSFSIDEGEIVGFIGPNGAGKTTTLKMLSGILYPTSGQARVLGYEPQKRQNDFKEKFAIVMGMKNQLWWDLPAMETFLLNKELYGLKQKEFDKNLNELVELLDIEDIVNVPVRKLSLGQRMKCELVAALIHAPKVLFLDEPTIGLDVVSQNRIREFLRGYNKKRKTTILLTSHYMDDVESLCKRVIVINHGELIYDGGLEELLQKYIDHKLLEVTFTENINKEEFKKFGKVSESSMRRIVVEVPKEKTKKCATEILKKYPVDDILINEIKIEDVIRKIFSIKGKVR